MGWLDNRLTVRFGGYEVSVGCHEPDPATRPGEKLDDATRAQLQAVVDAGEPGKAEAVAG